MWDKLKPVFIITRREVQDQFRDWRIIIPIVGLTIFFPGLMNFTARQVVDFVSQYGADLLAIRFIPFLLMIVGFFPMTVSLVIALESFAGEAERRTIEPLLSSPFTDWQLYLGKLLASLTFPLSASYLGILTYLVGILRTTDWQPEPGFILLILMLTTVQALVMVSAAVVISTQTTSVRAANLLSSFIVIPMALVIQGEAIIMFWGSDNVLWWVVLGEVAVAILLVRMGLAHFNRENLLGREIDILDFKSNWLTFWRAFIGQARNPIQWLVHEIPQSLRRLLIPIGMMCVLLPLGLWIGAEQAARLNLPPEILSLTNLMSLDQEIITSLEQTGLISVGGALYIWFHNLRVVVLATLLGVFSFGVLGALILMLPIALIGFITHYSTAIGLDPGLFLTAFIAPHAILEVPAMILSGAAIFRVGAVLVTPARNSSIGEAWLRGLADWLRVILVLVIPLFLGAAFLEAFVTPRVMVYLLGQ
jgi:uncharacterized membrane protein SpoIIM required for sporulation/ABC-type transport system involved in multi-copper enzyme maturation permease subunit